MSLFCLWFKKVVQFDYIAHSYPASPTPFIEDSVFPHCVLLLPCHRLISICTFFSGLPILFHLCMTDF